MYHGGIHGTGSCKSGPKAIWRWVLVCMVLGSAVALAVCGLLAGLAEFVIRQQNPALLESDIPTPFLVLEDQLLNAERRLCQGKRLYMYNVPRQFNLDILDMYCQNKSRYSDICGRFLNSGLGFELQRVMDPLEAWYRTDQFSLDIVFHERVKHYECLTDDPDRADLYYAPYYAGWDLTEYLFASQIQLRDRLSQRFVGWMMAQPSFNRLRGHKHALILGRIVWDFGRQEELSNWGNSLLSNPEVENMTALILERNPLAEPSKQMAVPYPTSFHPKSDAELKLWQEKVASSHRNLSLVSFAGSPRRDKSNDNARLRDNLFNQCNESDVCSFLICDEIDCQKNPHLVTNLLLRSTFCLQPPGDSPTRKGVFDCLVAGTIPVFFTIHTAYTQYLWHLPKDGESFSILFDEQEILYNGFDVMAALQRVPAPKIKRMQDTIVNEILPVIVYDHPQRDPKKKARDAVDTILDHFFIQGYQTYLSHNDSAPPST